MSWRPPACFRNGSSSSMTTRSTSTPWPGAGLRAVRVEGVTGARHALLRAAAPSAPTNRRLRPACRPQLRRGGRGVSRAFRRRVPHRPGPPSPRRGRGRARRNAGWHTGPARPCLSGRRGKRGRQHGPVLGPRRPGRNSGTDLTRVRSLGFTHMVEHGVTVPPAASRAFAQRGRGHGRGAVEIGPAGHEQTHVTIGLSPGKGLVVPRPDRARGSEASHPAAARSPADDGHAAGLEGRAGDGRVTVAVLHERLDGGHLSPTPPAPSRPVEGGGEDPPLSFFQIDACVGAMNP